MKWIAYALPWLLAATGTFGSWETKRRSVFWAVLVFALVIAAGSNIDTYYQRAEAERDSTDLQELIRRYAADKGSTVAMEDVLRMVAPYITGNAESASKRLAEEQNRQLEQRKQDYRKLREASEHVVGPARLWMDQAQLYITSAFDSSVAEWKALGQDLGGETKEELPTVFVEERRGLVVTRSVTIGDGSVMQLLVSPALMEGGKWTTGWDARIEYRTKIAHVRRIANFQIDPKNGLASVRALGSVAIEGWQGPLTEVGGSGFQEAVSSAIAAAFNDALVKR